MALYGHRQLSIFFVPVVEITSNGFIFSNSHYPWESIVEIDVWNGQFLTLVGYPCAIPRATITLKNGKKIRLNGRVLEKKGDKNRVGFWSGESTAFSELVEIFRNHKANAQIAPNPSINRDG